MTIFDQRHYERVLLPANQAETLPPWSYSSQAFFEAESERIFRRSWNGIGRVDRVAKPGDFAAFNLAGIPVFIVRDKAGTLRAFANSCRHRGTLLLRGEGKCRSIRCPYHSWAYALDGRLIRAPHMEQTPGFHKEDFGLVPVRLETRDGFAFVNFDETAPSLDDWLGDFSDVHAPWRLSEMVTARRREFEVACNWKPFLEIFNEYYHLTSVHPNSIAGIYDSPDDPEPVTGNYVTQFGTHGGASGLLADKQHMACPPIETLRGRNREGTRYTLVFPGLTFAASTDAMWIYEVYPLAPDRTLVGMTVCFPKATAELRDFADRASAYFERLDLSIGEDIVVLERQQAGLASPLARPGRLSYLEPNVGGLARWVASQIAD